MNSPPSTNARRTRLTGIFSSANSYIFSPARVRLLDRRALNTSGNISFSEMTPASGRASGSKPASLPFDGHRNVTAIEAIP
jgi:hypothetical protein